MTRQHFEAIARAIRESREEFTDSDGNPDYKIRAAIDTVAVNLARELATTNDRFDRARFLAACGCTTR